MELSLRAHTTGSQNRETRKDMFTSARQASPLVNWTFLNRVKALKRDGALTATIIMTLCGVALSGLLAVAYVADKAKGLKSS